MNRNRLLALLLTVLLVLGALTGCSATSQAADTATSTESNSASVTTDAAMPDMPSASEEYFGITSDTVAESAPAETPESEPIGESEPTGESEINGESEITGETDAATLSEKIIYTGSVSLQTTAFDETLAALEATVAEIGGFVESSSVSGNTRTYSDGTTAVVDRWAYYTVRIPADQFSSFLTAAGNLGNVTNTSRDAQNVTSQYTDYEARLESLNIQEERLLAMLEESGDLESLITLESRLSEVRYEIESIERNLRNLDQKLAYSTVNLDICEVEVYTPVASAQRTFGEKLSDAFADGWNGFVGFCGDFVLWFASALPGLVLFAAVVAAAVLVVLRIARRREAKRTPPPEDEDKK